MKIHIACVITWVIAVLSAYPIVRWKDKVENIGMNSSIHLPTAIYNNCDRLNEWEIPDMNSLTEEEKVNLVHPIDRLLLAFWPPTLAYKHLLGPWPSILTQNAQGLVWPDHPLWQDRPIWTLLRDLNFRVIKWQKQSQSIFFLISVQRNNTSDTDISRDAYAENKSSLIIDKTT